MTERIAIVCVAALVALSCGTDPRTGGETGSLGVTCEIDSDCGDSALCVCGTCTVACALDTECPVTEAGTVVCAPAEVVSGVCEQPDVDASVGLCAFSCADDVDCAAEGVASFCSEGICQPLESVCATDADCAVDGARSVCSSGQCEPAPECADGVVELELRLRDAFTGAGIADAEVCVEQSACAPNIQCATTDEDGRFRFDEVPALSLVTMTMVAPDYLPQLVAGSPVALTEAGGMRLVEMQAILDLLPTVTTEPVDFENLGAVTIRATFGEFSEAGQGRAGYTGAMSPDEGEGPIYYGSAGLPNADLTETSTSGQMTWINVSPGEYTVAVEDNDPMTSCSARLGEPNVQPETVGFEVRAGFVTFASLNCP